MILIRSRAAALALLGAWTVVIWVLCTSSRVSVGNWYPWMPWFWNLQHAPLFGVWAGLAALTLRPGRMPGPRPRAGADGAGPEDGDAAGAAGVAAAPRAFFAAVAVAIAYGVIVEWRQAAIPGRHGSSLDVLTDAVGAFGVPWACAAAGGARFWARGALVFAAASAAAYLATYA